MRKYFFLLIISAFPNSIISQIDIEKEIVNEDYVTTSSVRYTNNDNNYLDDEIKGSKFENEIFQSGSIFEENKSIINNMFYRYNAFKDDIEVKKDLNDPDKNIMILNKLTDVMVKISNDYYLYSESGKGYYKVLFIGNNYKLYKKVYKKFYKARQAANSFSRSTLASYEDRVKYFLISKEDKFHEIPASKGQRINFFGDKKDEIKTYVNKYKLDITEEKIFIKIVRYFDSFKNTTL